MKVSNAKKIAVCILAGFMGLFGIHTDVNHRLPDFIPEIFLTGISFAFLFCALLFIPFWMYKEKTTETFNSEKTLAFWQGVIIYFTALVFIRFGFLKLFGLHMNSSLIFSDMPAGSLSGYHLMDYFFGRAPGFKLIIGCLQIMGSTALLFRKTRLLGCFVLLPIVVNIITMNIFFEIGEGITLVAITLFLGLIYLILQDKEKLKKLFFDAGSQMPVFSFKPGFLKSVVRISVVLLTLLLLVPSIKPVQNKSILGKYTVTGLSLDNKVLSLDLNQDSILTTIYFDENETCVLRYNDYKKIKIGKASYDELTGNLKVIWRYPPHQKETSMFYLSKKNPSQERTLKGRLAGQEITASIVKVELPTVTLD